MTLNAIDKQNAGMPSQRPRLARFLIIGAGSRGHAYAAALQTIEHAEVTAIAEPVPQRRKAFGEKFIWGRRQSPPGHSYNSWQDFVATENAHRQVDGVFVCTLDETHCGIITALAPLGLHIMCEKPLSTSWKDCLSIYRALQPPGSQHPKVIFSIGHVLRYSPHNILLRRLLLRDQAIGEVLSMEHTEPVGHHHFSHSYVRGNWRKEASTAPSLLTKSCHDIDLLLWLLCSPPDVTAEGGRPHLPRFVSSTGALLYFRKSRKPKAAGAATNCYSCNIEPDCIYSARDVYEQSLRQGNAGWPVNVVDPEIEDLYQSGTDVGHETAFAKLRQRLTEDYDAASTPQTVVDQRPWFGRCVYESANDVCDDQIVTMTWEDEEANDGDVRRSAKQAVFHMVASTEAQCERRGRIYGTRGEMSYDSTTIRIFDFASKTSREYHPPRPGGGHGGGDFGLAAAFVSAVRAVADGSLSVQEAQESFIGCSLEEIIRSHGMVFAAEEARKEHKLLDWGEWWSQAIKSSMQQHPA